MKIKNIPAVFRALHAAPVIRTPHGKLPGIFIVADKRSAMQDSPEHTSGNHGRQERGQQRLFQEGEIFTYRKTTATQIF